MTRLQLEAGSSGILLRSTEIKQGLYNSQSKKDSGSFLTKK